MKYVEASKLIQNLSDDYSINLVAGNDEVSFLTGYKAYYKGELVAYVSTKEMYGIYPANYSIYKLPYGNKLWMILSELSMTPIDKRLAENKCNVIIGNTGDGVYPVWVKNSNHNYGIRRYGAYTLYHKEVLFTNAEFEDLIKHIKNLPDGEFQAKVAEHGKTLFKED